MRFTNLCDIFLSLQLYFTNLGDIFFSMQLKFLTI